VEDSLCRYVQSTEASDLGTKDCSSARRNLEPKHVWSIRVRSEMVRFADIQEIALPFVDSESDVTLSPKHLGISAL
jgi:hypothetical protein